jgi:hypothetical protein
LTAIAKMSLFAVAIRIARLPSRRNAAIAEQRLGIELAPASAISKLPAQKIRSAALWRSSAWSSALDFAAQGAPD